MRIYIPDSPGGDYIWLNDASQTGRSASLDDVPSEAPAVIIIPGQWARIYPLDLPKLRGAERLSAAGFALEDKLAAPIDAQHFAFATAGDRAGVIDAAKLRALMEALAQTDLDIAGVYADYDMVPPGPAVKFEGRVIVPHSLTAGTQGYSVDAHFYEGADTLPNVEAGDMAVNLDGAINFASGKFAPRRGANIGFAALGRIAAGLVILGIAGLGFQIMQARAASAQADYLTAQTRAVYTQVTGQAAPANPALTVTRALRSGGGGKADFMSLSAALFAALEATPGAQVETLDYDAARAQLRVRLIYPDLQTATQMERAAASLGADLQTGNLRERSGSMMGDAVLTQGGGS